MKHVATVAMVLGVAFLLFLMLAPVLSFDRERGQYLDACVQGGKHFDQCVDQWRHGK